MALPHDFRYGSWMGQRKGEFTSASTKPLLVLDLDETLISASLNQRGLEGEIRVGDYYATPRPGLATFMAHVRKTWETGIWTASLASYARPIVDHFVGEPLSFLWDRTRCTLHSDIERREWVYLKDIKKLTRAGYRKERIVFVDDTPSKIARSYGNYVHIPPFEGDPSDRELERLGPYLERLSAEPNVRTIEKRGWCLR